MFAYYIRVITSDYNNQTEYCSWYRLPHGQSNTFDPRKELLGPATYISIDFAMSFPLLRGLHRWVLAGYCASRPRLVPTNSRHFPRDRSMVVTWPPRTRRNTFSLSWDHLRISIPSYFRNISSDAAVSPERAWTGQLYPIARHHSRRKSEGKSFA